MGRMHSRGKGISSSALPYKRTPPIWLKTATTEVEEMITKAAKKGQMPSQIGVLLRDQHGIPLVKSVTGSKILRILKAHGEKLVTLLFDSCVWRPKCGVLILSDVRL
uniref:Small ribosomal subunit protein uS15 N-terminal domain-containing protein n=1 Tax=Zea mays TaxID=4577 RepID=A0A804PQX4_MAIZE